MNRTLFTIGNVVGYQAVWLASVAGAGQGLAWAGPVASLVFIAMTLAFGGKASADLRMLGAALGVGFVLDSAFAASGWLVYSQPWPWAWAAPVWIWSLWAGFSMTLNHSMVFLRGRPWLAALLGLFGGPMAYLAAVALEAVRFGAPTPWVVAALALGWALALPLLLGVHRHFSGTSTLEVVA